MKLLVISFKFLESLRSRRVTFALKTKNSKRKTGFTLIETLVAITLLTISIIAPMSLASKSLSSAYYARDQVTAFHLGQEAIESVRAVRDGNILQNALGTQTDILSGIPMGQPFTIDTRLPTSDPDYIDEAACVSVPAVCPPLEINQDLGLYGYGQGVSGWLPTRFTRTVVAEVVRNDDLGVPQEVRLLVTIAWRTGGFQLRTFTISENLYRWLSDGTSI